MTQFNKHLINFWETHKDYVPQYCIRGNCGIASVDLNIYLKSRTDINTAKIIKTGNIIRGEKVGGWIRIDKPDFSEDAFTQKERNEMKELNLNSRKLSDRKEYATKKNLLDELKLVPHSWVELNGEILDPSGFMPDGKSGQFDKLVKDKTSLEDRYMNYSKLSESMINEGTYASYKLADESARQLSDWMASSGILEPVSSTDLHVTTTYSVPDVEIEPSTKEIVLDKSGFEIVVLGRSLVLMVKSAELQKIHKDALDAGAEYSYDVYRPHISLSYDSAANSNILPLLMTPEFNIILSHEEISKLREEIPANSTSNVAGVDAPINDLAMFRRKLQEFYGV